MITTFFTILLTLDGLVYNVIDWLYDIFVAIATIDVFSTEQETINKIVTNVYVILGVVMLFALAYSLLKAVINPENFSKGDTSFSKLMQNIVVSIIIIAILPTCFNFAYKFQTSVLENDTIPKILFGDGITNPFTLQNTEDDPEPSPGRTMAYSIFNSFLHVDYDKCAGDNNVNVDSLTEEQIKGCSEKIALGATGITKFIPLVNLGVGALNNLIGASDTSSFFYYDNMVRYGKYGFGVYSDFTNSIVTGDLSYMWFFSTVVGIYVAAVLLNFVFDVALRFIKMLFFEIIAPIPVICRIIPGGKMKDVFSTWLKKVISVYLEVFIRVFVIVIGLYLILLVNDMDLVFGTTLSGLSIFQRAFARVIIILGIVTFIRQAPKLICDLFHIDSGDMKLGIKDKLAAGGLFGVANAVGSLVTSKGNPLAAYRGWKYGMKNADLHNIGGEANRLRAYKDARAQGVTRTEIFKDRMRRMFGFESSNKADDYGIENKVYTVKDENGNSIQLTPEKVKELETNKLNNNIQIAEVNSASSKKRDISVENATITNARGTFKNDGLDEIHKNDSKILEKLDIQYTDAQRKMDLQKLDDAYSGRPLTQEEKDTYNVKRTEIMNKTTSMSLVGNYNSLKAQLDQNYQTGVINDEAYNKAALDLADLEKMMQEKFVTAASHESGKRIYVNYDGSKIEVDDGGKFYTNYQKFIDDLKSGVLKDSDGNKIDITSFVDKDNKQLEGWALINEAFKKGSSINNEIAVEINKNEREKRTYEQANKIIDAIFEQRKKMQEQAKNENKYKARKLTSEYNDNNAPKK